MTADVREAWKAVVGRVTGDMERDLAESNVPPSPAMQIAHAIAHDLARIHNGNDVSQLMAAFVLGVQLGVEWSRKRGRDVA